MFPKNSAFKQHEEALRADPYSPHSPEVLAAQRQSYTPSPSISQDQLERWYAMLNEEAGLVTQEGRTRVAADQTAEVLRQVADEIYSYLRG